MNQAEEQEAPREESPWAFHKCPPLTAPSRHPVSSDDAPKSWGFVFIFGCLFGRRNKASQRFPHSIHKTSSLTRRNGRDLEKVMEGKDTE